MFHTTNYFKKLYEVIYNIIKERKLALQKIKLENNNSFDGYEPICLIDYLRMNNRKHKSLNY
jgi:hypothetical protein